MCTAVSFYVKIYAAAVGGKRRTWELARVSTLVPISSPAASIGTFVGVAGPDVIRPPDVSALRCEPVCPTSSHATAGSAFNRGRRSYRQPHVRV